MKYLIKDLSRMTGLSPARIRKWQERFGILQPEHGPNGYYYYSNEDLFILKNIASRLEAGESISAILDEGRAKLLAPPGPETFTAEEWSFVQATARGEFSVLERTFEKTRVKKSFRRWVREDLQPAAVLVGRAWEREHISVSDEHAYSRWFTGYFQRVLGARRESEKPVWLVVVYPGDEHELGALMHYGVLRHMGVPARFCGELPEQELYTELYAGNYRRISISLTMTRRNSEIQRFEKRIKKRFPELVIRFGGYGLSAGAGHEPGGGSKT